jgi:hypothetical protein
VLLTFQDRLYEARILYEGALAVALAHDLHASASRAYNNLAEALERSDCFAESVAVCDRRLELARRLGDRHSEVAALAGPISSLDLLGRWDEALVRAAEAEERATTAYAQIELFPVVGIRCERGELEQAREFLAGLTTLARSEDRQIRDAYAVAEARLLRTEGNPREALAAAERALAGHTHTGATSISAKLALVEALEAATMLDDPHEQRRQLATLDGLRPGQLTPALEAQRARFRGRLAAADPEPDLTVAAQMFRELEMPFYLAVTEVEHGEWLAGQGRAAAAEPLFAAARETFERLEAKPWLERLDARSLETLEA